MYWSVCIGVCEGSGFRAGVCIRVCEGSELFSYGCEHSELVRVQGWSVYWSVSGFRAGVCIAVCEGSGWECVLECVLECVRVQSSSLMVVSTVSLFCSIWRYTCNMSIQIYK